MLKIYSKQKWRNNIYCKDADSRRYPASTTKLLTGLLLAENKQKTDILQYTKSAKDQPAYSLNINYMNNTMQIGDKMSADDVMKGLLLYSGNDTAYIIADNISGNSKAFAQLMNKRAKDSNTWDLLFNKDVKLTYKTRNHTQEITGTLDISKLIDTTD